MTGPTACRMPDGRLVDVWISGPADGMPLIFHAGTPGSGLPFEQMARQAADRGLRLVSYSRAGYGGSTRRPGRAVVDVVGDVAAILDALGAESSYVLGWSGGGPHALATVARLPERVRAGALIGGVAPYPAEGLEWTAGMGPENVEEFEAALAGPEELIGFKERAWPEYKDVTGEQLADTFGGLIDEVDRGALTGTFTDWLAAMIREGLRPGYWGWFDDDMAFARPWDFELDEIQRPVHIWQGGHDLMVPFAHGKWLAAHVPNACPHLLPEHGHLTLAVDSLPTILDELIAN